MGKWNKAIDQAQNGNNKTGFWSHRQKAQSHLPIISQVIKTAATNADSLMEKLCIDWDDDIKSAFWHGLQIL